MSTIGRYETTLPSSDGQPRRVVISSEIHLRRLRWYVILRRAFPDGGAGGVAIRDFTERAGVFWRYRAAHTFAEQALAGESNLEGTRP